MLVHDLVGKVKIARCAYEDAVELKAHWAQRAYLRGYFEALQELLKEIREQERQEAQEAAREARQPTELREFGGQVKES